MQAEPRDQEGGREGPISVQATVPQSTQSPAPSRQLVNVGPLQAHRLFIGYESDAP